MGKILVGSDLRRAVWKPEILVVGPEFGEDNIEGSAFDAIPG